MSDDVEDASWEDADLDAAGSGEELDRTAKLEQRLDRMTKAFEGYVTTREKTEKEAQSRSLEGQIRAAEAKAASDVDAAEQALASAFDEGDGATIARAQRVLSEATARKERVAIAAAEARNRLKQSERRTGGAAAEVPGEDLDTTNLEGWKRKHSSWYGVDSEMTRYAHSLDQQIRENGVLAVGSSEYFDAIDRQMRQKFPDRLKGSPPAAGGGRASEAVPSGSQRIPASVAEGYRRMGINVDDPAVAKRMLANRDVAVKKGWLPDTPATGRILQR